MQENEKQTSAKFQFWKEELLQPKITQDFRVYLEKLHVERINHDVM